jgi:hypothetical protein
MIFGKAKGFWDGHLFIDATAVAEFILTKEVLRSTVYHWGTFIEAVLTTAFTAGCNRTD